jgi:phosphomannomutase
MKFGTSGVRGLVEELLGGGAYIYATGFARHMLNRGDLSAGDEVLVGQDYRPSSPQIANICDDALRAEGLVPIHCGPVPTPALALFAAEVGAPALMITGSHIPADRNGIKFYRWNGEIDKSDEDGVPLRGDLLGMVAATFLGATTVVTPVTSNSGIEKAQDFHVVRTRVGSPYVIVGISEAVRAGGGNVVGFEANGGFLTASRFIASGRPFKPLPTRDSFIPILAALNFMVRRQVKLSKIAGQFDFFAAKADRLENFPTEASDALMRHLRSSDDAITDFLAPLGSSVGKSDVDGLRITLAGGDIIHFRPSGNAPEMRCYVESKTDTGADALLRGGLDIIRSRAESRAIGSQM